MFAVCCCTVYGVSRFNFMIASLSISFASPFPIVSKWNWINCNKCYLIQVM